ncbi:MAG TPA: hypothetical protein VK590_02460 [Saprospiraceae bacterium]|nr:hypothetical protein [Saprospiraceae bacterium]
MEETIELLAHSISNTEGFDNGSRVWVFQSDRALTGEELKDLKLSLDEFTNSWTSHSMKVKAAADVFYRRFLVFMADETQASVGGCSQDSLMRQVQSIQNQYNINLLDRLSIALLDNTGVRVYQKDDLVNEINNENISRETFLFDNLVNTKKQFEDNWLKPISTSWLNRFLA